MGTEKPNIISDNNDGILQQMLSNFSWCEIKDFIYWASNKFDFTSLHVKENIIISFSNNVTSEGKLPLTSCFLFLFFLSFVKFKFSIYCPR